MKRQYENCTGRMFLGVAPLPSLPDCEHCEGEDSGGKVRLDDLRGRVCRVCDGALDAMYGRPRPSPPPRRMTAHD